MECGNLMFRLIVVILISGSLVGQQPLVANAEGQQAAAQAAKIQYPLDAFTDFSALMIGSQLPNDDRESPVYRSGKWMRTQLIEGDSYLVTDLTKFETYGIAPGGQCIHDPHTTFRNFPFALLRPGVGSTVEGVISGKELVDGHSCRVEDITISSPQLPTPMKMRLWEADDLKGFPIKIEVQRRSGVNSTIRYKNVVLGPQDAKLFRHPENCQLPPQPSQKTSKAPAK